MDFFFWQPMRSALSGTPAASACVAMGHNADGVALQGHDHAWIMQRLFALAKKPVLVIPLPVSARTLDCCPAGVRRSW